MKHPHYTFDIKTLYSDLINLTEKCEAFYFTDHSYNDKTFRIFDYRLASYSDFLHPHALECRGHTFLLENGKAHLVSLPMEKFFNLGENPFTLGLDLSKVIRVQDKLDGSLISTVNLMNNSELIHVKSKGSFKSDQATSAYNMLNYGDRYWEFSKMLRAAVSSNYTVNMEYTAPNNQIVIAYEKPELTVLNIRDNHTGEYIDPYDFGFAKHEIASYYDRSVDAEWLEKVSNEIGNEGYILHLDNGQKVKLKNSWYCNLHLQKEQIQHPRRLFEAVLKGTSDDLKTLFKDDPISIERIEDMEDMVKREYNFFADCINSFYNQSRHLSKKEYAILGQKVLGPYKVFSMAMNLYLGKDDGLKEWMIKNYKLFISDNIVEE